MKASVRKLVVAHYATYVDARTGKQEPGDHLVFEVLPLLLLAGCWATGVTIPAAASAGILVVAGLLSAFLFGVMLPIADRAAELASDPPPRDEESTQYVLFLGELSANSGYASLVSFVTAAVFVAASAVTGHTASVILCAVGFALLLHLGLVMGMVISRVFAVTQNRLDRARTTGTVTQLPRHRNAS